MRIEDMTLDQLLDLNEVICERIDYLRAKQDQDVMKTLCVGNQVRFANKEGSTEFGIVIKINRKTVIVLTKDQRQWKMPPGMLTVVKDVN
ncbi:transposase [Exilibacterium tricleocarpae]|uniref:Transposase n=1 Tax=Exilibacterium tricleocarpae TaxID=2591008 RepID=A0A545SKW4_9GAMM|nr:transposase [Exilibacterium tricleocarpae]TQV65601.1 transposase [Exilibacterium tricleocarpae]